MATTHLKSLTLKAFRSFDKEVRVDFPDSGLVLFSGNSGSGKSSILLALSHAMGYCPYPATELQSWLTDDAMEVEASLVVGGEDLQVHRGGKAFVKLGDKPPITGAVHVTKSLERAVGMTTELLAALTYRPQQTRGLFLSKTNAEMQEFLSILLELEAFEDAIADTNEKVGVLEKEQSVAENVLWNTRSALETLLQNEHLPIVDVTELDPIIARQEEEERKAHEQMQAVAAELEELRARMQGELVGIEPKPDFSGVAEIDKEIEDIGNLLDTLRARRVAAQKKEEESKKTFRVRLDKAMAVSHEMDKKLDAIERAKQELEALRRGECPKCHQPWVHQQEIDKLERTVNEEPEIVAHKADTDNQIANHKARLAERNPIIDEMMELEQERGRHIMALEQRKGDVKTKAMNVALAVANEERAKITAKYKAEMDAKSRLHEVASQLNMSAYKSLTATKEKAAAIIRSNQEAQKRNITLQRSIEEQTAKVREAAAKLERVVVRLNEERDLATMLKTFMASIFDEVLVEIAAYTNDMLKSIPNVAHVTINFRSDTVTQKGTIKKAIVPVLVIDGEERPLRSALSGGMLAAVELAVDLAVRKVISARVGQIPNWLVLDESFEGLGPNEKEACMQLLMQAGKDVLILVVDHASEFKEMFNQVIHVTSNQGRSSLSTDRN